MGHGHEDDADALTSESRDTMGRGVRHRISQGLGYFSPTVPTASSTLHTPQVPGSVIASSDLFLLWKPRTISEVTPESLIFLEIIKPTPEVGVDRVGVDSVH